MQKFNLISLFGKLRIILILFFMCLYSNNAVAQCGKTSIGTPAPLLAIQNQTCKKWTYGFDSNNPTKYKDLFPNNCNYTYLGDNGDLFLTCYWNSPLAACKANIADENKIHPNNMWTLIDAKPSVANPTTQFICRYKIQGSTTIFEDRSVYYEDVEFSPRHISCETEINGPYRNCSDNFTLCGTQYTEGQRGFEFTQTQKNLMRKVNKERNNQKLASDLAGYKYPKASLPANQTCFKQDPNDSAFCIEPDFLDEQKDKLNSWNVHHVVPKKRQTTLQLR